ncbi:uncharacterized protein LOC108600808 [Drosophila busckii]|uniref:uncharacterized protein LOC108600808 n=1 Tax=Drosophila busckii TaxID=30019 RepID=UPI00083F4828|nr:uncharacterized protein LOC108600808 [Drosophila busckii]
MARQAAGLLLLTLSLLLGASEARIYERCELKALLQQQYGLPAKQAAILVCIAEHSSGLNSAMFGGGTGVGGGSHGLFQISDVYWCAADQQQAAVVTGGNACGVRCSRLRDDHLGDDVACVRRIYAEHQRISGDGFNAWQAYQAYCRQDAAQYVAQCGGGGNVGAALVSNTALQVAASYQPSAVIVTPQAPAAPAKIYTRCELAQELYYQHKLPMSQIPTWVCIAQHESSFNTAAVGRLNADGSADHGLFQISDLYWCGAAGGKGCHASCNAFLDPSIADDVQCIRRIHKEHTQISGDGFNAWTVYQRNCRHQRYEQIAACFSKPPTIQAQPHPNAIAVLPQKSRNPYYHQISKSQNQQVNSFQSNPFLRQSVHINPLLSYTQTYVHQQQQQYVHHHQQPQQQYVHQQQYHYSSSRADTYLGVHRPA